MYLEFFSLREKPFGLTPDPRFLFFSEKHREALDHLLYGIHKKRASYSSAAIPALVRPHCAGH